MKRNKTAEGILHFADFKSPCRGNFINSLEYLRPVIESQGKQVVYLFPAATAKREWAQELKKQATVYFLGDSLLQNVKTVRGIIKRHNIKIIHSHFYKLPYILMLDLASAFKGIKHFVHLHCALYIHGGVARITEKILLGGKTFIGCSQKLTDDAKKYYPKNKAYTAKNAIWFPRLEEYEVLDKEKLGLSLTAKTLMMFGFLYEVKGVDLALEAVSELNESGENLQLILILTSNIDEIKDKITKRFGGIPTWLHLLPPRNDITSYYKLCDAFLAPSRSEGLPYSVIEASYLGLPVVMSDIPAHKNLELPCGFSFESENVGQLKESLMSALYGAYDKDAFAAQSEQIKNDYQLSTWADRIVKIYTS